MQNLEDLSLLSLEVIPEEVEFTLNGELVKYRVYIKPLTAADQSRGLAVTQGDGEIMTKYLMATLCARVCNAKGEPIYTPELLEKKQFPEGLVLALWGAIGRVDQRPKQKA